MTGCYALVSGFVCAKAENPETETIDPDTIVIPSDAQSKQLLDLEVEDAAIEDTIYELGKAYERADEVVGTSDPAGLAMGG